ncbi:PAS domain-containing protein, partial [Escherichia coli]
MIDDLVVPEDAAIIANATTRPSERADLNVEYRVRRADTSELRWLERRAELECDDSGAALRMVGIVQDITERRRDRDAMARLNATLE